MNEPQAAPPSHAGYEANRVRGQSVFLFGAVLAIGTVLILLLIGGWLRRLEKQAATSDPPPSPLATTRQPPPAPRLQVTPIQDLQAMRAAEEALLHEYAWVDRNRGIVRIPIDRAIDLLIEQGLSPRAEE
jgi:hypothetical protein